MPRVNVYFRYEEAIACLSKEIEYHAAAENNAMIAKVVLAVVLLKLTLGDFVAADSFYRSSIRCIYMSRQFQQIVTT